MKQEGAMTLTLDKEAAEALAQFYKLCEELVRLRSEFDKVLDMARDPRLRNFVAKAAT